MTPYRIVIADDHSLIRQGLKSLIHKDSSLRIIAEAGNGVELLECLRQNPPDMAILDITMPQLNGIEAIGKIKKLFPVMAILILTMHSGSHYFYQAMAAGAHGYLIKDDSDSELLTAIRTIREGKPYVSSQLSPEVTGEVIAGFRDQAKTPFFSLSDREKQVLKLVVQGCSSRVIGTMLSLSPRTIDHHRASLLKKYKMKNTVDLVNHVARNGVLLSDE
ncbi:response regulator transcription factor [uncultured Desulfobulbus sp.]|uniref:response regulator transcription factor n=1 Tax=uncultured Desulfobulbus sp. TaxID=239745 RepID=UPI0029C65B0E|nr:response regulator transcription factor [uncultured Desulfobulbus sp.]